MYKSGFSLFCKISITLVAIWGITSAQAAPATDDNSSSLKLNLGSNWKVKSYNQTSQTSPFDQITLYVDTASKNTYSPDVFTFYIIKKGVNSKILNEFRPPLTKEAIMKQHDETISEFSKYGCKAEDIQNILPNSNVLGEWGITWQCSPGGNAGFTFFVYGDPETSYNFVTTIAANYPMTSAQYDHLVDLLKAIQICYKNKPCTPLVGDNVKLYSTSPANTNSPAHSTANNLSSLKLNLAPSWKTAPNPSTLNVPYTNFVKYTNTANSKHETFEVLTGMKGEISFRTHREVFPITEDDAAIMLMNEKRIYQQKGCTVEEDPHLVVDKRVITASGIFWQCPNKNRKGFAFFVYGDPNTAFTMRYNIDSDNSPISPAEHAAMVSILKGIQICYKNAACAPLFNSTNTH